MSRQSRGDRGPPLITEGDSPAKIRTRVLDALLAQGEGDAAAFYKIAAPSGSHVISHTLIRGHGESGANVEAALKIAMGRPELLQTALDVVTPPPLQRSAFVEDQSIHRREAFEDTAAYREYYAPTRLEYHQRLLAYHGDELLGWVGLLRLRSTKPFQVRDRRRLQPIVAPVIAALTHAARSECASVPNEPADFVVHASGRVDYASASGQRWLRCQGFRAALTHCVRGVDRGEPPESTLLGLAAAQLVRLDAENGRVRYLVHVRPLDALRLSPLAHLSPTERAVAERAAAGCTVVEIATALSSSQNTVRAHMKSLYRKLDVANRVELAEAVREPRPLH